jgi:hypothetical protein
MRETLRMLMAVGGALLAGCGPELETSGLEPDAVELSAPESQSQELAGSYIWESTTTDGYVPNTTACSMTAGSACTTPGQTCTWVSANYPGLAYHSSYVCRQATGTYGPMRYVSGRCPSYTQTNCPNGNPQGQPCGHKGSDCYYYCYMSGGPMAVASCQ